MPWISEVQAILGLRLDIPRGRLRPRSSARSTAGRDAGSSGAISRLHIWFLCKTTRTPMMLHEKRFFSTIEASNLDGILLSEIPCSFAAGLSGTREQLLAAGV